MLVETWPISRIIPYPKNARKIPQAAIDSVAKSLKEFGWRQPIVVEPSGVIIVGHVRRLGALQNGWAEAPVHVAHGLTPAQIRAYRLMDNRSHEEAMWEPEMLKLELMELRALDLDLGLTGFSEAETLPLSGIPPAIVFKEYDETAADGVKFVDCPSCGHHIPL
jgi:ParB-like chromosome segregation protein Spo0J